MPLTVTVDGRSVDVSDVDLSLDAFTFDDWMRLGYALGDDAIALLEADPKSRLVMLGSERVQKAVLWARLAPLLVAAVPQGEPQPQPDDVTIVTEQPPPGLDALQVVAGG